MEQIKLYDLVFLKEDLPKPSLMKGIIGTVIYIYKPDKLFEVDFISKEGESIASVVLENNQILKLDDDKKSLINELTIFHTKL